MIQYGDADVMIAGGAEYATTPTSVGGFCAMKALSTRNDDPTQASRPWDEDRDGFVWATAPASWCSRNTNTPRRAARASTASSPASA